MDLNFDVTSNWDTCRCIFIYMINATKNFIAMSQSKHSMTVYCFDPGHWSLRRQSTEVAWSNAFQSLFIITNITL